MEKKKDINVTVIKRNGSFIQVNEESFKKGLFDNGGWVEATDDEKREFYKNRLQKASPEDKPAAEPKSEPKAEPKDAEPVTETKEPPAKKEKKPKRAKK